MLKASFDIQGGWLYQIREEVVVYIGGVLFGYVLLRYVCFNTRSNIGLCMPVKLSFICSFLFTWIACLNTF
jgi:hypothetical protein